MEKPLKPNDMFIRRKRVFNAIAAAIFIAVAVLFIILTVLSFKGYLGWTKTELVIESICAGVMTAISLTGAALEIRNLFYPYLLTADEKGVYDYSGFRHAGFISWRDIAGIEDENDGAARGVSAALIRFFDYTGGDAGKIVLNLKNYKAYKRALNPIARITRIFDSGVIINASCADAKRSEIIAMLTERLAYYGNNDEQR